MNRKIWSVRRLAPLGVLAVVACAAGAQAAGGGSSSRQPAVPRAASPVVGISPAPVTCRPRGKQPAAKPPSEALKNSFGILRRERTDDDALPERALQALERRGLKVADPEAARLLRADRRARAWVAPVPDVAATPTVVCRSAPARGRSRGRRGVLRRRGVAAQKPREGLAVVSVEGAPGGGGGALRDLQRGIAPPSIDPCAGADRDMLGVSGIVPDGVEAVFVTSADGTATRADVHDNGYAFVLPRPRRAEARYLVWTGTNGTPHVQPLPALTMFAGTRRCSGRSVLGPQVTPDPWSAACGAGVSSLTFSPQPPNLAVPVAPGRTRRLRPGGNVVVPARPLPDRIPAPIPLQLCPTINGSPIAVPGGGPSLAVPTAPLPRGAPRPRVTRPPAPRAAPAPSDVPPPRAPTEPAPSPAPAPREAPPPTVPAAPAPEPPRAP